MARPGSSTRQLYVGRYFGALLALLAALYAGVYFAGPGNDPLTPKLGLDLQGGASVILTPSLAEGQKVRPDQLTTAVDIIQRRVNGLGVAEAEVVTQGDNIVVSVPGGTRDSLRTLSSTAQLRFREVLQDGAGNPAAEQPQLPVPPQPGQPGQPAQPGQGAPTAPTVPTANPAPPQSPQPQGRALPPGLTTVAGPSPAPPAAPAASAPAAPAGSAPAAPAPGAPAAGSPKSGDVYTPEAFAALDCSKEEVRRGGVIERPDAQIIACDQDGASKYHLDVAKVVGTDVKGASAQLPQDGTAEWQIIVSFTGEGQRKWSDLTAATVGKNVAIVLDGLVLSAPVIQSRIDGDAQISGSFTQKSAAELSNTLKYGALPLSFTASQVEVISPTLGEDQLKAGLLAGGLGLLIVVIYALLYYRILGVVTIVGLAVSGLFVYATVALLGQSIGFALTLAGIAGFIVSVGVTADSFIVYFERLKDEMKEGRTPRVAADRAWVRARRTVISADIVSILAAVILYFLSVGSVRGFAFTLGLSTLIDLTVVFLFTRPLVSYLSRFRWFGNPRISGLLSPDEDAVPQAPARRRTAAAAAKEA